MSLRVNPSASGPPSSEHSVPTKGESTLIPFFDALRSVSGSESVRNRFYGGKRVDVDIQFFLRRFSSSASAPRRQEAPRIPSWAFKGSKDEVARSWVNFFDFFRSQIYEKSIFEFWAVFKNV